MLAITNKIAIATLGACVSISLFSANAYAFQLAPMTQDAWLSEDGVFGYEISVLNDTDEKVTYQLQVRKVELDAEGLKTIEPLTEKEQSWFTINPTLTVEPRTAEKTLVELTVPQGVIEGTAIYGIEVTQPSTKQQEIQVDTSILALLFVTPTSTSASGSYSISDVKIQKPTSETPYFQVEFKAKNEGKGIVQPQGNIEFKNIFGKTLASSKINPGNRRVLEGEEKTFVTILGGMDRSLLFGKYKIALEIRAWPQGEETVHEFQVWQATPKAIGLVAFVLGLLVGILILRRVVR